MRELGKEIKLARSDATMDTRKADSGRLIECSTELTCNIEKFGMILPIALLLQKRIRWC